MRSASVLKAAERSRANPARKKESRPGAGDFEAAHKLRVQLAALVDQLAQGAGGAAYRQHVVRKVRDGKITFSSPELQVFGQKLSSAAPHCGSCPRCHATHAGLSHSHS